jgi:hypothetical protein
MPYPFDDRSVLDLMKTASNLLCNAGCCDEMFSTLGKTAISIQCLNDAELHPDSFKRMQVIFWGFSGGK